MVFGSKYVSIRGRHTQRRYATAHALLFFKTIMTAHLLRKAVVSALTNCWKVVINEKTFAVLPAHVAIFKQNDVWTRSHFLNGMNDLKWKIPANYITKQSFEDDFAWAEVEDHAGRLELSETKIEDPTQASFYFNQPYDVHGNMTKTPTLGAINAMIYPSPGGRLLEAVNAGFRGMSGALAFDEDSKILGEFTW
jgi:hypothetical protein